ncbi:DinB family protein [Actinophytocola xanthii]|uniref:Mini-circle protein n=1 Tax=Actinophytocola xanthii TaxID=1912961 RepID=A0A1Q8CNL3_9PSEU|nr:DinB family protein [Actinophytocola xanthii]OLF15955.1 hypothetical protein BU204_18785 [Actinophytocola xanthii]
MPSSVGLNDLRTKEKTVNVTELEATVVTGERADLLEALGKARHFLRFTTRDLTDEQAALRTTVSELCLGGLVKHVTSVERNWSDFIVNGPGKDFADMTEEDMAEWGDVFRMLPGETLEGVLADYEEAARGTDELLVRLPDLDARQPLPKAPWFEDSTWSVRQVFMHIVAETAQHAGHADIIRESLDGAKSMG